MCIPMTLFTCWDWMSPENSWFVPIGMRGKDSRFLPGRDRGIISFKNEFEACLLAAAGQRT